MLPTLLSATLIGLLIGSVIVLLWQMTTLLDELIKLKTRKLFREDVTMALINRGDKLTIEHIQSIAETRGVTQNDIQKTLKVLLRELLAERNISLQRHQSEIEKFLSVLREKEPFEGLPNEVRLHLERLKDELNIRAEKLEPLTIQIRELVSIKHREARLQKYYTVGGFVLGVVGLAFAAYTYFYPPSVAPSPSHSVIQSSSK